jgi:hypothetical protein
VWVPVGTNVALVVIAAALNEPTAIALTAIGAVVATGAVIVYVRESELYEERIAHLQATIPTFATPIDHDAAVNLVPKPSPVVAQVLRQLRPVMPAESMAPRSTPPVVPIDRS